jgi:DNA ligase D-like protein (predicted 3'-phosphoesterase)
MAKFKYCIQEHHATRLHYDLRLEHNGVAKSWAIPKMPDFTGTNAEVKRLAVQVDDHDIDYMNYEGEIPKGQYGAGKVVIWDKGEYEPIEIQPKKWSIKISGVKLNGEFLLLNFKENNWLLSKKKVDKVIPTPLVEK